MLKNGGKGMKGKKTKAEELEPYFTCILSITRHRPPRHSPTHLRPSRWYQFLLPVPAASLFLVKLCGHLCRDNQQSQDVLQCVPHDHLVEAVQTFP